MDYTSADKHCYFPYYIVSDLEGKSFFQQSDFLASILQKYTKKIM